jgi:hypothetical protein
VVAQQRDDATALGEGDHLFQHPPAVWATVEVVAQENQGVARLAERREGGVEQHETLSGHA